MRGKILQTINPYSEKLHSIRMSIPGENEVNSKANKEPPDVFQRQEVRFCVGF